jgi:hypothetical protein
MITNLFLSLRPEAWLSCFLMFFISIRCWLKKHCKILITETFTTEIIICTCGGIQAWPSAVGIISKYSACNYCQLSGHVLYCVLRAERTKCALQRCCDSSLQVVNARTRGLWASNWFTKWTHKYLLKENNMRIHVYLTHFLCSGFTVLLPPPPSQDK